MKIEFLNIVATEDGIYEYEEDKILTFVPANDIKKLSFGFVAPIRWPLFSLLIGVAMICGGILFGVLPIIRTIITGDNIGGSILKGYGLISLHILFGIYFSKLGLRKQNCLILDTKNGTRKLTINGAFEDHKVIEFLSESSEKFEYTI